MLRKGTGVCKTIPGHVNRGIRIMERYNVILCGEKLKASIAEGAIGPKSLQLLHASSRYLTRHFSTYVNFLPCKNNFGLFCFPSDTLKKKFKTAFKL